MQSKGRTVAEFPLESLGLELSTLLHQGHRFLDSSADLNLKSQ